MKPKPIIIVVILVALFVATSCSQPASPGGDYGPVTADRLRGKHSVFATGTSGAQFTWEFAADRFTISGDGGPIPEDVRRAILGNDQVAKVIEGRWTLADGALTLSSITADRKDGFKNVILRPFQTPVVRVELKGTQYVFRRLPSP